MTNNKIFYLAGVRIYDQMIVERTSEKIVKNISYEV